MKQKREYARLGMRKIRAATGTVKDRLSTVHSVDSQKSNCMLGERSRRVEFYAHCIGCSGVCPGEERTKNRGYCNEEGSR